MTRVAIPEAGRIETPLRDEEGGFGGRRDDFEAVEEKESECGLASNSDDVFEGKRPSPVIRTDSFGVHHHLTLILPKSLDRRMTNR